MKHDHSHLALLIIAITITVFAFSLYGYMRYAIGPSVEKAIAAQQAAKDEQERKSQKDSLTAIYNDTAKGRAGLVSYFVADDQKVQFIERIESLGEATQSKVIISDIVADDLASSPAGTFGHISMRLDVTGSWSSIMRVLRLAETMPYKSTVSDVRIGASGTGTDEKEPRRSWRLTFSLDSISIRREI